MRLKQLAEWGPEMKKPITTFVSSVALALPMLMIYSSPANAEYDFQVVNLPGSSFTQTLGINDAGNVTGGSDVGAFVYNIMMDEYTIISTVFSALDISNSGVIVGDNDGVCAIRDKKGNVTEFLTPSSGAGFSCQPRGVNSKGQVSGFVIDANFVWRGFIHDPVMGTTEEFLPSPQTFAHAINAQGQVAGSIRLAADAAYSGSAEGRYGYIRQTDGSVKLVEVSQSIPGQTRLRGISESGLVAGYFFDPDTGEFKSFVATLSSGTEFETIVLTDDQIVHQRPCNPANSTPPAGYDLFTDMTASQVRNDGVVVGSCTDLHFNATTGDLIVFRHGFIATPTN